MHSVIVAIKFYPLDSILSCSFFFLVQTILVIVHNFYCSLTCNMVTFVLWARVKEGTTIMDKSVDTFEQNKRFLSASLRKFKKHFFTYSLTPSPPFQC